MPLHFPPAASINNLVGGYNSSLNYTNLADNQTNDAKNVEITIKGSIKERNGYVRRLKSRIVNTSSSNIYDNGEAITGHFQLIKLGSAASTTVVKSEIVAAGNSLYKYTDTSATAIATGLTDSSQVYWDFAQIQDPRSATDDIVIATNGRDKMKIWNGVEASAANLSATTSATQVPIAKFISVINNRVYALNINDNTNVDAKTTVKVSTFDNATGAPRPQRFDQSFVVGGSDKYGEITGKAVLNDQLIIFKRNATYKFIPGSGRLIDTAGLIQMDEAIGCIAPYSVATIGNTVVFLSENGVYAFDGTNFIKISDPMDQDLSNTNRNIIHQARGIYYKAENQYWLAIPTSSAVKNDKVLVFNLDKKVWHPPYDNMNPHVLSNYMNSDNKDSVIIGDHRGYIYEADKGTADGLATGYSGYIDTVNSATLTDTGQDFEVTADGLAGLTFTLIDKLGQDTTRTIISNTSETITLDSAFAEAPTTANQYVIGGIDSTYRTKDFDFGFSDITKLFRQVTVRASEQGDVDLKMNYIVDFKTLARAGTATMDLITDGMVWDLSKWDAAVWDGSDNVINKINLRPSPKQGLIGNYLALRFFNRFANKPWEIFGFDVMFKQSGRRRY